MIFVFSFLCATIASEASQPSRLTELNPLIRAIVASDDPAFQLDLLRGTLEAVNGRRRMAKPSAWTEAYATLAKSPNPDVRDLSTKLAMIFGDPTAFTSLRALAADPSARGPSRIDAIESLSRARDEGVVPILQRLLSDRAVRAAAIRGLAATDHPETPALILKTYPSLTLEEKADAIGTLAARPNYALALLTAIENKTVPMNEVPAAAIQALANHADPRVKAAIAKLLGAVRPTSEAKKSSIRNLKAELTPSVMASADRSRGRLVFAKTCASCHTLFDAGAKIGPELTGSQRSNLDYLLTNIVDPGASVAREYQVSVFATNEGRVVVGIVKREDDRSVSVQTANELVVIPKTEIDTRAATPHSMMPEGLLNGLHKDEVRDLIGYLVGPGQVPLGPDHRDDTRAR